MSEAREQTRAEWLHGLVDEQEKEIERLRARLDDCYEACRQKQEIIDGQQVLINEIAEKDRHIEELKDELNAELSLLSEHDVVTTIEQVNEAWKDRDTSDNEEETPWIKAEHLSIIPCEKCGGDGRIKNKKLENGTLIIDAECPSCAKRGTNGWKIKEVCDE